MSGRITNNMLSYRYLNQVNGSYTNYNKLFEQADGSKIHRSSDDSVGYSKYLRYQNSLSNNNQFHSDTNTALSWMKNSDAALTNVTDLMATFVEKTVNAGNSTNNESDMKDIAKELFASVEEMVNEMNTSLGDRYLFSGQSDTTMPFSISAEKVDRGMTKTLSDEDIAFFNDKAETGSVTQFLSIRDTNNNEYYLDTVNGEIYDKEFVDGGYKKQILSGYNTLDEYKAANPNVVVGTVSLKSGGTAAGIDVADYFNNNGVIKNTAASITDNNGNSYNFNIINQYVVNYAGDSKKISMVTQTGMTQPKSDTVNATGQDIFGSDIFDYESPDGQNGTAMINNLLTVVAKIEAGDNVWCGKDGITISNAADHQTLSAQTTIAARYQSYTAAQTMLSTQNESLTSDINDVSGTDIAKLSTQLVQCQTLYSLALSMGSKILPGTLADYL